VKLKAVAAGVWLAAASVANAQCVMCFRTAAAQQIERARVLNAGILVLGIPPFLILAGFLLLCWRRSRTFADDRLDEKVPETIERTAA
jgi:hypothetical protein